MTTPNLVGTDIHLEYWFAQNAYLNGWEPGLAYLDNSALSLVILAPALARILHLDVLWVLKAVYPAFFALVPVLLYLIYKQWVGNLKALLAVVFFVSVPTFFIELTGIARQQIGEVFLALLFYVVLSTKWRVTIKLPAVIALGGLVIVSHYSLGPILIGYLSMALVAMLVLKIDSGFPKWAMGAALGASVVMAVGFYGWVAGGMPLRYMTAIIPVETQRVGYWTIGPLQPGDVGFRYPPGVAEHLKNEPIPTPKPVLGDGSGGGEADISPPMRNFAPLEMDNHDALTQVALGLDFGRASLPGKIFRLVQYLTQVMILVGCFLLRKTKPFLVFGAGAVAMMGLVILLPGFGSILNATRFYHLALFALAPAFAVGGVWLLRRWQEVAGVVAVYLFFTAGLAFEFSGAGQVAALDLPYNAVLSNHRLDLTGSYTEEDKAVRRFIQDNKTLPVYADFFGVLWLQEEMGIEKELYTIPEEKMEYTGRKYNPPIPEGSYIYLRSREGVAMWVGIGLRRTELPENMGFYSRSELVYQAGNAKLLKVVTK